MSLVADKKSPYHIEVQGQCAPPLEQVFVEQEKVAPKKAAPKKCAPVLEQVFRGAGKRCFGKKCSKKWEGF